MSKIMSQPEALRALEELDQRMDLIEKLSDKCRTTGLDAVDKKLLQDMLERQKIKKSSKEQEFIDIMIKNARHTEFTDEERAKLLSIVKAKASDESESLPEVIHEILGLLDRALHAAMCIEHYIYNGTELTSDIYDIFIKFERLVESEHTVDTCREE